MLDELLKDNKFASGGLLLMVLGYVGKTLADFVPSVFNFVKNRLITSFDITNDTDVFDWVNLYLKEHKFILTPNKFSIYMKSKARYIVDSDDDEELKYFYIPGVGFYLGKINNNFFWFYKTREEKKAQVGRSASSYLETFYIQTFKKNKNIINDMVEKAKIEYTKCLENKIKIYTAGNYGEWNSSLELEKRSISSVFLENEYEYELLKDARYFLNNKNFYVDLGIPYKRSYLFYGPPGTGKTSIIKALAGEIRKNLYILPISEFSNLNNFMSLLGEIKPNSIVLLEDIESFFDETKKGNENTQETKISYRDLLNIFDGVLTPEGIIFCLTSNDISKINPSMLRSGRIDVKKYIGYMTDSQKEKMIKHFYNLKEIVINDELQNEINLFIANTNSIDLTPARLQEYFLKYKNSIKDFFNNYKELLENISFDKENYNI